MPRTLRSGQPINVTTRSLPDLLRNLLVFCITCIIFLSHISLVHGILPFGTDFSKSFFEDTRVSSNDQRLFRSLEPDDLWQHEERAQTDGFEKLAAGILLGTVPLQRSEVSQQASSGGAKSEEGVPLSPFILLNSLVSQINKHQLTPWIYIPSGSQRSRRVAAFPPS